MNNNNDSREAIFVICALFTTPIWLPIYFIAETGLKCVDIILGTTFTKHSLTYGGPPRNFWSPEEI